MHNTTTIERPTGTITFLFTDIEGSTRLWAEQPEAMEEALQRHDTILREAIEGNGGYVFKTIGDAFCAAFPTALDALEAALAVQRALRTEDWQALFGTLETEIRIRVGLHTGTAQERDGDYFGPAVNHVARLHTAGHGQQILLSLPTYELIKGHLPAGVELRDLGNLRLKDLPRPERTFQVITPDLPSDFPPLRTLENHPHNIPLQLTSFIGREREIADVVKGLSSARLLTLTGPGGSGKTRLAMEVARRALDSYPDGAWLVELAALTDPALVAPEVATVLGVREQPESSLTDLLAEYLASRKLLLILDNCEHLIRPCAALASTLLQRCPDLRILATSRQVFNITGETIYRVPTLPFPDPSHLPSLDTLGEYESIQLFVDRARLKRAGFEITRDNALHISQICYHLDGLPLAIELAAARIPVLSVADIVERLDQRFRLLTGGMRASMPPLPRHQTLRAAIDWSYDLLSPPAQALLRVLSVLVGSFTFEAVEALRSKEEGEYETLDLLSEVADGSLLVVEERDGETRYRLLDTIRHYAEGRADAEDDVSALRKRHMEWFLSFADAAVPHLRGPEQHLWLRRLEREHDNLRSALDWSRIPESGAEEAHLNLARALSWFWFVRGHWVEGRIWLEEALALTSASTPALVPVVADICYGAGLIVRSQGDYPQAIAYFEKAMTLYREAGKEKGVANCLINLGIIATNQGNYDEATRILEESVAIMRKLEDKAGAAIAMNNLANLYSDRGDYAQARDYYAECAEVQREAGNLLMVGITLCNVGYMTRCLGDYEAARRIIGESLEVKRSLDDKMEIASSLHKLAELEWCLRNYEEARRICEEGFALLEGTGDREVTALLYNTAGEIDRQEGKLDEARASFEKSLATTREKWIVPDSLYHLGHVAQLGGDFERARQYLDESLEANLVIEAKRGIAECLACAGRAVLDRGYPEESARLFGAAARLFEVTGYKRHPDDEESTRQAEEAARARLDKWVWSGAWGEGQALSPQDAAHLGTAALALAAQAPSTKKGAERPAKRKYPNDLTEREVEVLRLLAIGLTDAQIAERLFLSSNTVHAHLGSVYNKLNVKTRLAAARFAQENGLL
jgi:predicted ATPase/class 3 adenylate cyclase/DNA-binding CsgD family transcriptional regulator/Tfp pilus assembly protein PilF